MRPKADVTETPGDLRALHVRTLWFAALGAALLLGVAAGGCAPDASPPTSGRDTLAASPADSSARAAGARGLGAVRWSYRLGGGFLNTVQPVADAGRAFVAADSVLRCVELATGRPCWRAALGNDRSLGTRALVEGDSLLFLNHFDEVWAFDKTTGRRRWRTAISDFEGVDLQRMGSNATHLLVGGRGQAVRLDKRTGRVDLRLSLEEAVPGVPPRVFLPALATNGTVCVPTFYRPSGASRFAGDVRAYAPDGTLMWQYAPPERTRTGPAESTYTAGTGVHGCALDAERAYVSTGQAVHALDRETGAEVWTRFFPDHGFGVGPSLAGGRVVIGTTEGSVFALRAEDGRTAWEASVNGGILAPAVVQDRRVFQIDDGFGALWIFDLQTGRPLWHGYPPGHERDRDVTYRTPPAVEESTMVVVGSRRVYGLAAPDAP